jgi:membrane-bound serine protease (ClpP class)
VGRLPLFADDIVLAVLLITVFALLLPSYLLWAVVGIALYSGLKLWLFRAHFRKPAIGVEAMRGRVATALGAMDPRGQVDLDGEIWDAEASAPVRKGERVVVQEVEGLKLRVAPLGVAGGEVRNPPSP